MNRYQKILALCCVMSVICSPAMAGSYQLNDYTVTGLGRAYSGVGVVGDDYSSIAFNPAGMSLKESGMQTGVTAVNLRADINGISGANSNGEPVVGRYGKMDHWVSIPQMFAQYKVNNKLDLGFGIYAPYGLATRYSADWFGSTSAIKSQLTIVDLSPALSYRITDKLSLGASLILRYIYGNMTNRLPNAIDGGKSDFELDGWTLTGTLGLLYEPVKDTRIGLSWRARSTQQVKGDHKITENGGIFNQTATGWASPSLPETFTLSLYQKIQKFGLSATARWTHWSQSFPEFVMKSNSHLFNYLNTLNPAGSNVYANTVKYNYDNAWTLNFGTDYYYNDNWTFRAGVAYDEGATHNDTTRTHRIPDNDRYWASCGFSYMKNNVQIDVGYSHLFVRTSKVAASADNRETFSSKYAMHSDILGLQVQYGF